MNSPRIRWYALLASTFPAYFLIEFLSSRNASCLRKTSPNGISSYFENDVLLEFEKFGFNCSLKTPVTCPGDILKNSTRVIVNGRIWEKDHFREETSLNSDDGEGWKGGILRSVNLISDSALKTDSRPSFEYLSCDDMEELFLPDEKEEGFHSLGPVVSTHGELLHPVLGKTSCFRKQGWWCTDSLYHFQKQLRTSATKIFNEKAGRIATVSKASTDEFFVLNLEKEKRVALGTDTILTTRLLGVCIRQEDLTIIVEDISEATAICKDEESNDTDYSNSGCFRNEKLKRLIDSSPDRTKSALTFIKGIICLFSEMEKKGFFVQDIHGKHISVTSNFSVIFNNVDVLSHHGSRNILSGSTCKYDENCPEPSGVLWNNGSANRVVYEKCRDALPLLFDVTSKLHHC